MYPIVLGGGHEIAFGHYCGIKDYNASIDRKDKLGIINFDAHFDLRPYPMVAVLELCLGKLQTSARKVVTTTAICAWAYRKEATPWPFLKRPTT